MADLYKSKLWLQSQLRAGVHPDEIAKKCNTNRVTIYRWMQKHGLRR